MRFVKSWLVPAVLLSALTGCGYSGPPEGVGTPRTEHGTAPPPVAGNSKAPGADPRELELEEMRNWSAQQLQPAVPGQKAIVHSGQWSAPRVPARLSGTLGNDGAGCVVLQAGGGDDYTLIFPEGSRFDGETLVMPAGPPLPAGSRVSVGGTRVAANESLSMCLNYSRLLSVETATVLP